MLITLYWPSSTQTLFNDVTVGNTGAGYRCDLVYETGEKLVHIDFLNWRTRLEVGGNQQKLSFMSYPEVLKNSLLTDVKETLGYISLPRTTAILTKPYTVLL